jgi:hypothetical protein
MKIYHVSGYAHATVAAKAHSVQPRTLYDRMRRNEISMLRISGLKFFHDGSPIERNLPEELQGKPMEWVGRSARKNKIAPVRIYEQIVLGNIPGITLGGRVFIIPSDPDTDAFLKTAKIR